MNRRWICSDVWMDILPSFDHAQLGLKMALLSDRFDILVDKHFDGKSELTIWKAIEIRKDKGPKAKLSEWIDGKDVDFPFPGRPLPNKIRFKDLRIYYIDHSVITFLHVNKQIWDRSGTNLALEVSAYNIRNVQHNWDAFARQIWPIFATTIRHFIFKDGYHPYHHLDNLRRRTSPTILTDLNINSIISYFLCPDGIADDGPNATAGQALSKWLHAPSKNGQPKQLRYSDPLSPPNLEWLNSFKEAFLRATTSVAYNIQLYLLHVGTTPIEQFELVNERTNEKLTFMKESAVGQFSGFWLLKRCPLIIGETATVVQKQQQKKDENSDANLNTVFFGLYHDCIGPLSPPDQSDEKVFSTPAEPSDQRKKNK